MIAENNSKKLNNIINLLNKLSDDEKEELGLKLLNESHISKCHHHFTESAHNNSNCPHCHSNHIVKIGKLSGKQRFKCKECGKHYTITTRTIFFSTKKSLSLWVKYIDLMGKKLTLREIAKELNINLKTAFYWRHKILNVLTTTEKMSGIIEADETYFRESQKGSRKLNRPARKSGKSKLNRFQKCLLFGYTDEEYKQQQHKRGLSKDLICVLTATDRTDNIYGKPVGYGKVQPDWVESNLQGVITANSTLITDGEKSYDTIKNVKHKKFTAGLSKSKTYNLGRIDNVHSNLKTLLNGTFKGVATKYLEGYVNYVKILKNKSNIFDKLTKITSSITEKDINRMVIAF